MKNTLSAKEIGLSVLYIILIAAFAVAINIGFSWFCNEVLFVVLNWFNHQSSFLKWIIFIFGGIGFMYILFALFQIIGLLVSRLIFGRLPINFATIIVCIIVYIVNVFLCVRQIVEVMPSWSFWVVLEFMMLCVFILTANSVLVPTKNRKNAN